jgi:hypothetical protein
MKILFLTDNFPPEVNAPATRTYQHCRAWVEAGAEVTVVTGFPNFPSGKVFPGYRNVPLHVESVEGIRVIRVWTYMAPNAGFLRRTLDYASFAASASAVGYWLDFDVLVATSPQFFTAVAGSVVGMLKGRPWVFELRDIWPDSIVATGAMRPGFAIQALERLELDLYRSADLVVSVTDAFKADLVRRGIPEAKIRVVPNGIHAADFAAAERVGPRPREPGEPFRVGYLGTHGLAHGLDVVFGAAELLRDDGVEFVLVGDGADKSRLAELAGRLGLPNVRLLPPVPRQEVAATLAEMDAMLVPLRDTPTFRNVIPSKIFEAAAARRPIVLGVRGEAESLVLGFGAGLAYTPEDAAGLADAVRRMEADAGLYRGLQDGCARLAGAFDRRTLALKMLGHLQELTRLP